MGAGGGRGGVLRRHRGRLGRGLARAWGLRAQLPATGAGAAGGEEGSQESRAGVVCVACVVCVCVCARAYARV